MLYRVLYKFRAVSMMIVFCLLRRVEIGRRFRGVWCTKWGEGTDFSRAA